MQLEELEKKMGYAFKNPQLLEEALTHPSFFVESIRVNKGDFQRLEFLGDAVLGLAVTEKLFQLFPSFDEGKLTKLRARLVSRKNLCSLASFLEIGKYLHLGKGEEKNQGRTKPSNLANALESVIGALYLDGGWDRAKSFIFELFNPLFMELQKDPMRFVEHENSKGLLQELLQKKGTELPIYRIVLESGEAHNKWYEVEVSWKNQVLGKGAGKSKKEAELRAAKEAFEKLVSQKASDSTPGLGNSTP
ncbi:ribonuclease III [Candidatus Methylacidiphilum infernorum]|uniref:Ribonuclease 3 n=1 Tax=Candidatus Methylacidiphilum infernorum TaxID=511746 RepID=A0ABX7PUY6_9BACT|nr:ribonuclease III [Candidatus Methylacidiphilum infernorum]QSR86810.1 ribonuclease III [Candidatus Methylacidiphilum infernorum]